MVEWEARIKGDARALSELSGELDGDIATIEKREEDYFLKSSYFEGENEFEEVNNIAENLITTLSGIASVHLRTEIDPELYIHDVIRIKNGERKSHAFVKAKPAEMRLFAGKPDLDAWVTLSQEKKEVEELLNLVEKGLDWRNLYAIYEFIQDDVGGNIYEENWGISKSEINRFTATANSRDILGDEARHGNYGESSHPDPMKHGKAKSLIERICKKWLDSKMPQDTSAGPSLSETSEDDKNE